MAMQTAAGMAARLRDGEERWVLLEAAAEALAQGIADGSMPEEELRVLLKDVLLAECEDESREAAARCELLRVELAAFLREALRSKPGAPHPLVGPGRGCGDLAPRVRVDVRGTAGRTLTKGSFSVGSDPYCDVQVFGDATVMPLQCVVVPLPGGVLVVDLWSGGGTRAKWRWSGEGRRTPVFGAGPNPVMVVGRDERIVFRLGAQTTVTLGPCAQTGRRPAGPEAAAARAAPRAASAARAASAEGCEPLPAVEPPAVGTARAAGSAGGGSSSGSPTRPPRAGAARPTAPEEPKPAGRKPASAARLSSASTGLSTGSARGASSSGSSASLARSRSRSRRRVHSGLSVESST
uniref:FHA domain-containing protein n=1 Tax=Alexandrium monilatum TaxID=311494 RepID=A0A7S4VL97_9DINO